MCGMFAVSEKIKKLFLLKPAIFNQKEMEIEIKQQKILPLIFELEVIKLLFSAF